MNTPTHTQPVGRVATGLDRGMTRRSFRFLPPVLAALAALSVCALPAQAQVVATPAPSKPVPEKPVVVEKTTGSTSLDKDVVTLDPFTVNTEKDDGFMATNAGTATKLGLDMKDMSAPYSVMTGEFIKAMGINDLQAAVLWSTNGSPVLDGQGADLFGGGGTSTASTMYNIRGQILNAGQQRNFFVTAGIEDTYNVDRIDFGRGPNAVLFNTGANDALGGGISTQGKRPHLDRDTNTVALTVGSWAYYRSTLDVNRVLIPDKLAVRANVLYQRKGGWQQQEYDNRTGVTLSGLYRFSQKTELFVEGIHDKVARARTPIPYFDNVSGWNGTTTFSGPITNDQINGLAPLADGTTLAGGGSTNNFQGSPEGVFRTGGNEFVFDPASNTVMNWINTGSTRRGDENPNVPLYINGVTYSRNNNGELLPFGNAGAGSNGGARTPGNNFSGGGQDAFYDMTNLPDDRFSRQIANSNFRLPSKRFSAMPREPLFVQPTTDVNFSLRHQVGDNLYFELSGDANRVVEQPLVTYLGLRTAFIDINKTLPNGAPNPHFLDPYSQVDMARNRRNMDNYGLKASLAYVKNLGKWGDYTFNLSAALTGREVDYTQETYTTALAADPREWMNGNQRIRVRYYWNSNERPWSDAAPTSAFDRVRLPGGNSYTTSTTTIKPRWVLSDWSDRKESTKSFIFAFAGRYFDNKLIFSPGIRVDQQKAAFFGRLSNNGFMPNDPNWDGRTLDSRYFRPDAPADWFTLTYIPKNADGTPRSSVPVPATGSRPTINGVNGVDIAQPQYANDRFRNDYNVPRTKQVVVLKNVGLTYHALPWLAAKANYSSGYKPGDLGRYFLDGSEARNEAGLAYEGALTFSFFKDRLAITPRYYFNKKVDRLGNADAVGQFNSLMSRKPWNDPNPDSRNSFGYTNILGGDYFSTKNTGRELEINGRITRGWRVMANYGTGKLIDYDRWKNTKAFLLPLKNNMSDVLKAAGGAIDTTQHQINAGHSVTDSPGLAIADPAISDAMITAAGGNPTIRTNAVNDYNNIWTQFDNIGLLVPSLAINRMTFKIVTDYTIQTGRFKALRAGLSWQYVDNDTAGFRSGDTIANPAFNPALPVTASNRPWMDDPAVDVNTPIFAKRPSEVNATFGYTYRMHSGWKILDGKEIEFQLLIRNVLNTKNVYYQDDGVALRPPGGDLSLPYRTAYPTRPALYQRPINVEFTTILKF
jgi:hypothetical protein